MRECLEAKGLGECLESLDDDEGLASDEEGEEGEGAEGEGEEGEREAVQEKVVT